MSFNLNRKSCDTEVACWLTTRGNELHAGPGKYLWMGGYSGLVVYSTSGMQCSCFWSSHSNSRFSANKMGVCMWSAGVYSIWWVVCSLRASCTGINVASVWAGCFLTVAMAFPYLFLLFLLSCTLLHHGCARPFRSRKAAPGKGNGFSTGKKWVMENK